jgi:hypothetical protein
MSKFNNVPILREMSEHFRKVTKIIATIMCPYHNTCMYMYIHRVFSLIFPLKLTLFYLHVCCKTSFIQFSSKEGQPSLRKNIIFSHTYRCKTVISSARHPCEIFLSCTATTSLDCDVIYFL